MSQSSIPLFVTLAGLVLAVVVTVLWRRRVAQQRVIATEHARNRERQDFVIARLDLITRLLENRDMPLSELELRTEAIVKEMESQNIDGVLDPLIADTTGYLREELQKRRAT